MKIRVIILGIIINLLGVSATLAQLNMNSVSANVGIIQTLFYETSHKNPRYAFYPELQCSGDFLVPSIRWTAYWGYWTDGVNDVLPVMDAITYSYSSHIVGGRFTLLPEKLLDHWTLPIGLFAGIDYHFITKRYVGGFGYDGNPGQNLSANITTLEVGLNVEVEIHEPIRVRGEIQQFIPFGSSEYDRIQRNRRAYKVGLALIL